MTWDSVLNLIEAFVAVGLFGCILILVVMGLQ